MSCETIGDFITAAAACHTREEADSFVEAQIALQQDHDKLLLHEQARANVMQSIGYVSGYYDRTEAGRILELFKTRHPYFGAIEEWPSDPEEILMMGFRAAQRAKRDARAARA